MQEQSGRKALRVWGGLQLSAELKNQQITGSRRKELLGAERTEGTPCMGRFTVICGTRKSAETRTMPEGIAGSRADRNSFVGKGIGRVFAGLENQQKPGRCRKELLGAERTGIASWERASGGFLRDSKISRNPDDAGRNCWEQSGQEFLRGKGYREGFCGTQNRRIRI